MPALDLNVKVTCGNCGTSVTKLNLSRHKSSCTGGTFFCANCPNFFTKSRDDLNYHIAKKHETPPLKTAHRCKICFKHFSGFYALWQHKTSELGIQMKSADLTWIISLKMTTHTSKKNSNHVNISSLTLSLKKKDIVFSISPCQPSTTLWLLRNWI